MSGLPSGGLADADLALRTHGKTFAWARRFLGSRHAARATLLYAFCRHVDDLADESEDADQAREALDGVRNQLRGVSPADGLVSGAMEVFDGSSDAMRAAEDLIDGVQGDLGSVRCETEGELLRYCYRVAGTVGVMMCHALDRSVRAAYPHAVDLGMGMQLTNICRDIHEDATRGRRYIPASLVGNLEPDSILDPSPGQRDALVEARSRLLDLAECYYRSGSEGLSYLPLRARVAILIAAENYRAIGPRVRALDRKIDERAYVSVVGKLAVTSRALSLGGLRSGFWRRPEGHDPRLHEHLSCLSLFPQEEVAGV